MKVVLLFSILAVVSCGQEKSKKKKPQEKSDILPEGGDGKQTRSQSSEHTVLVIDDGFDMNHPDYKDQIAASYSLKCEKTLDRKNIGIDVSRDQEIKDLIDANTIGRKCTVREGIKSNISRDFNSISDQKSEWNDSLLNGNILSENIFDIVSGTKGDFQYHGTSTAGLIAYKNPKVKLVLVEIEFTSEEFKNKVKENCVTQRQADQSYDILRSEERVRDAIIESVSDQDAKISEIAKRHNVSIVNFSGGSFDRISMEKFFGENPKCAGLDLRDFYSESADLDVERRKYSKKKNNFYEDILFIQAAGNSSVAIDSPSDLIDCPIKEDNHILIGAYDAQGKKSAFTNYGDCVYAYSLGSAVISPGPKGFKVPLDGTSFAAPLATRHFTLTYPPSTSASEMKRKIKSSLDNKKYLPTSSWPREVSFQQ